MTEVTLQNVAKHYGQSVAVENMTLSIRSGELIALLGPSGCGKTTTLRMIGGFVDVSSGRICSAGRDITGLAPNRRNMGFVFQNYALFPHMTVAQNVAFGLEMRKVSRAEIERKVKAALERVRLGKLSDRLPKQLSGGQQQRVAIARALVVEPDVLLLDEPLSNLDAALRHEMKTEIRQLQQSLGVTTVLVTHDQDEAISTADRMVLMNNGRVEQIGEPSALFDRPASRFTAEFMGIPNLLRGRMKSGNLFELESGLQLCLEGQKRIIGDATLALRAESLTLATEGAEFSGNVLKGQIQLVGYHGTTVEYQVRTSNEMLLTTRVTAPALGGNDILAVGTGVDICWPASAGTLVPET
ncbi:ABC transporter ATP-binding protein [Agrobacterium pusense]|nr:ABC transporter ATP-binding protein [Agrobacterium pusense]MDH0873183.1 ABC transporter ATP-binding protein [Agrobacterium pusense]